MRYSAHLMKSNITLEVKSSFSKWATWKREAACSAKLTAYIQINRWTGFLADAIGNVAGEWPLIVAGHPNGQVGASVAQLYPLAIADHAVAAVKPRI